MSNHTATLPSEAICDSCDALTTDPVWQHGHLVCPDCSYY